MKIFSPYPSEINDAIRETYADAEFVAKAKDADIALPALPMPLRIGEVFDLLDLKPLKIIGLDIDLLKKTVSQSGKTIDITEKEAAILQYLSQNPNAVSRDEMIKNIWNYHDSVDSKTVENHIYRLRGKIADAFGKEIIITDGKGYKLIEN